MQGPFILRKKVWLPATAVLLFGFYLPPIGSKTNLTEKYCLARHPSMQFTRIPSFIRLGTLPRAVCASIARQWWKQCWRDRSFSPNQRIGKRYSGRMGQEVKLLGVKLLREFGYVYRKFSKNEKRPNETPLKTPEHKKSELPSDCDADDATIKHNPHGKYEIS